MAITMDWAASSTDVFLPVLEPGRPKIKVPANSISTKGLLPYLPSWCVLGGSGLSLLIRGLIPSWGLHPHDLI